MVHEHIAVMPVDPHMRIKVELGDHDSEIFDIEMEAFHRLPLQGEGEELQTRQQQITDFLQTLEKDEARLGEFYKMLAFPLSHISSQTSGGSWKDVKSGFNSADLRGISEQVHGWKGDRTLDAPMYWAFEIIALNHHNAAIDDPTASACEIYTDALIDIAATRLPFLKSSRHRNEVIS